MSARRKMMRITLVLATSFLAGAATCNQPVAPDSPEPFTLRVGQEVRVGDRPLALRFAGVTQDSRCPRNVQCVWAGDAVAHLQMISATDTTDAYLHTNPGADRPTRAELGGYDLELVGLDPYPEAGSQIPRDSYVATLRFVAGG